MKKIKGLTQKEVEEKIKQGKINKIKIKTNESFSKIICKNIFTYFNFIFLVLSILVVISGSFRNLTFLPVIIINTFIGIIQEIRSKKILSKIQTI